jgi:aminoglycoside phosphotransferase
VSVERQVHAAVVGLLAPGAHIQQILRFRQAPLPFPAKLVLATEAGSVACVVKVNTEPGRLQHEADVLAALADLKFSAPRLLAGPEAVDTSVGPVEVLVLSHLQGDALPWIGVIDVEVADRTCRLLFGAIDDLHALTPRMAAHEIRSTLPTRTLDHELAALAERQSPWAGTRIVQDGLNVLRTSIPRHRLPLVFSNGDYNPLNVLADEAGVTGWVDFEHACFEDPYIGLPKFQFWADDSGWSLASRIGLVERFLYRQEVSPATFMVRVVLRGLTHLLDTTPDQPPVVMLREIDRAIQVLRQHEVRRAGG